MLPRGFRSVPRASPLLDARPLWLRHTLVAPVVLYGPNASPSKTINGGFPDVDSSKNALGKVDYHLNDHHSLSGSYFFGNDNITAEDSPELLPEYGTVI
jgi:hypothetical protein